MRATLAATLLAALLAAGCEDGPYVHRGERFRLDLPEGWTVREYGGQPCMVAVGPDGEGPGRPNLNVVVTKAPHLGTLGVLVEQTKRQAAGFKGFALAEDAELVLAGGMPAHQLTWTHAALGPRTTVRQVLVYVRDRAFIVTAAARTDRWAALEPALDAALASLRVSP